MNLFSGIHKKMWKIIAGILLLNTILAIILLFWYNSLVGTNLQLNNDRLLDMVQLSKFLKVIFGYIIILGITSFLYTNFIGVKRDLLIRTTGKMKFLKSTYLHTILVGLINALIWLIDHIVSVVCINLDINDFSQNTILFDDVFNGSLKMLFIIFVATITVITICLYVKDKFLNNSNKYLSRNKRMLFTGLFIVRCSLIGIFTLNLYNSVNYMFFESGAADFNLAIYYLNANCFIALVSSLCLALIIDYIIYYKREVTL